MVELIQESFKQFIGATKIELIYLDTVSVKNQPGNQEYRTSKLFEDELGSIKMTADETLYSLPDTTISIFSSFSPFFVVKFMPRLKFKSGLNLPRLQTECHTYHDKSLSPDPFKTTTSVRFPCLLFSNRPIRG